MEGADEQPSPATMDELLPYLAAGNCDAALRLVDTMVEAGLMDGTEAREWSARLRAWKAAHTMEPGEA